MYVIEAAQRNNTAEDGEAADYGNGHNILYHQCGEK